KSLDELSHIFNKHKTDVYAKLNWKEDEFFGYQLLNGLNPMMIHRCSKLPENFPVTEDMVKASLFGKNLEAEIQKGNIFLVDYKRLHGVTANVIHGKQHFLAAPLCLLYVTPEDKLIPIAIQLKQEPGEDNPIFLPTDSEYDWLLAKIFVRSADFAEHELNFHLLRTHLLAEVFAVSTLRNLPMVHPLYKLLISHFRYTLQINTLARQTLVSENGVITEVLPIPFLSVASLTYSSLCMPEDIIARGLESIPNFFYREDGLKLWAIVHRFVQKMIGHYYTCDSDVQKDCELQNWIKDIFFHGFLAETSTGIPQSFSSVTELVKFLTMVIFTVSVQHAAVSNGQFDFGGWMPNFPISLQQPPPTTKGQCTESTMLKTFPDISTTVHGMAVLYLLSTIFYDFKTFHNNPNRIVSLVDHFNVLKKFNFEIQGRNVSLPLSYTYLNPNNVENSVAL
uniref:Hydroperoxide isomerase ALOXE3-like n=1 Tax=Salmo trutta TaxID=8032 RepID=A0A674A437_SALTR